MYCSSCGPNTCWCWNNNTFSLELRVTRRIEPDEELTLTYIDHRLPRAARQQALQDYHFTCQCAWCSLPTEESLHSDRNRHEILTWYDSHLPKHLWFATASLDTNESYISEGERIIEVCKKEGLDMLMLSFTVDMVCAYLLMADIQNCRKYAQVALDLTKATSPPGHPDISTMEELLENPRKVAGKKWGSRLPKNI